MTSRDRKSASGGGVSSYFTKPSWQAGGPVLAGQTMRCVPDVSAISVGDLMNVTLPGFEPYTFDGVGVLIFRRRGRQVCVRNQPGVPGLGRRGGPHQTRRAPPPGSGPVGSSSHLYPLSGSGAFNDITSGSNGAYAAGPGYDLCTGLGSPNVGNLIAALANPSEAGPTHRLVNVSTRAQVGTGSNIADRGICHPGPAGTQKNVLVRGIGPALAAFGVAGRFPSPSWLCTTPPGPSSPATPAGALPWYREPRRYLRPTVRRPPST